ncbi:type IV pilus biogenesis protein PilP [Methylobacillus sp. Pita2]|uniref:type IV pilus biogenesis protein PilP n=1 Tax=Methylobacillus sp. Pita2 TaxID=3383245 RepID=UPI0038B44340
MQKNNGFLMVALAFSAMFHGPAAMAEEAAAKAPTEVFTIGDYSAMKKKLAQLKLEVEIKKQQSELDGTKQSNQIQMQNLPVVPLGNASSKVNFSNPDDFELSAIFGRMGALKAEVKVDGRPYIVEAGSRIIPGWAVTSVSNDRVVLHDGKKSKTIFMAAASSAPAPFDAGIKSLPPVPSIGSNNFGR